MMTRIGLGGIWRLGIVAALGLGCGVASAAPVVMISIDGMKPEYVSGADAHGLRIPFLRSMMRDGVYADGVTGVWPTLTFPSHTTLVTGVTPAVHGIFGNTLFDPMHETDGAWYWYSTQMRAQTLWQAAHAAGLRTASVGWPVTVDAPGIDFLIPEYWRGDHPGATASPTDRYLMAALTRPNGMLEEMSKRVGPYMMAYEDTVAGDEIKTRYSIDILRMHKPGFMTIHLNSLDSEEHEHGPFSAEADKTLEALDGMVARLAEAARAVDPAAVVLVVSDHGFMQITHHVNLTIPFLNAGLIESSGEGDDREVTGWKAQLWSAGGMVAVMLHDADDKRSAQLAGELLHKLAADPKNGIAEIVDKEGMRRRGGFPDAAFVVVLKPGYYAGDEESGELVTAIDGPHGGHGYSPEFAEMRASFLMAGAGVAKHRDLGVIDMLQVAPTVASVLGVSLPDAKAKPLNVRP